MRGQTPNRPGCLDCRDFTCLVWLQAHKKGLCGLCSRGWMRPTRSPGMRMGHAPCKEILKGLCGIRGRGDLPCRTAQNAVLIRTCARGSCGLGPNVPSASSCYRNVQLPTCLVLCAANCYIACCTRATVALASLFGDGKMYHDGGAAARMQQAECCCAPLTACRSQTGRAKAARIDSMLTHGRWQNPHHTTPAPAGGASSATSEPGVKSLNLQAWQCQAQLAGGRASSRCLVSRNTLPQA